MRVSCAFVTLELYSLYSRGFQGLGSTVVQQMTCQSVGVYIF